MKQLVHHLVHGRRLANASPWLSFLTLASLLFIPLTTEAAEDMESIHQKFLGDWELVGYVTIRPGGEVRDMNYIGRLSYDDHDNMWAQGMPQDLPERASNAGERITGGFAYWGKVSYNLANNTVIHHVEGSPLVPQWVGGDNIRFFEFSDGLLKLSLKNSDGRTTATLSWRKIE